MIFVTGGRAQGKTAFALEMAAKGTPGFTALYRGTSAAAPETEILAAAANGRRDSEEKALRAGCVLHLEAYIRRSLERGENPEIFVRNMMAENGGALILSDEIGCGIVPADPFQREYREAAGRLSQELAAGARAVYRVVCGIGLCLRREDGDET